MDRFHVRGGSHSVDLTSEIDPKALETIEGDTPNSHERKRGEDPRGG